MRKEGADSPSASRLAGNTAVSIVTNGWAIVISLVMLPVLLRGLGPEAFGAWALLQAFSAITGWTSMLDLGLSVGTTRWVGSQLGAGRKAAAGDGAMTSLMLFGLLGVIILVGTAFCVAVMLPLGGRTWTIAGSSVLLTGALVGAQAAVDLASRGPIAVLDGLQRLDLSRGADSIRRTVFLVSSGLSAMATSSLLATLLAGLTASIASAPIALVLVLRRLKTNECRLRRSTAALLIAEARSLSLLRPLGVVNRTMDRVIITAVSGLPAAGALEVAGSLQAGANALVAASTDTVTSAAAHASAEPSNSGTRELTLTMTRLSIAVSAPLIILLMSVPDVLLSVWLGADVPKYADEFTSLSSLALLISLLTTALSNALVGTGNSRSVVLTAVLATVLNLALSIAFALFVGALGVLVGTIVSSLVTMPLLLTAGSRNLGLHAKELARQGWFPGLMPSAVMAIALAVARLSSISTSLEWLAVIVLAICATAYATYNISLTNNERAVIRQYFRRATT